VGVDAVRLIVQPIAGGFELCARLGLVFLASSTRLQGFDGGKIVHAVLDGSPGARAGIEPRATSSCRSMAGRGIPSGTSFSVTGGLPQPPAARWRPGRGAGRSTTTFYRPGTPNFPNIPNVLAPEIWT
jgi:hypothetical protein